MGRGLTSGAEKRVHPGRSTSSRDGWKKFKTDWDGSKDLKRQGRVGIRTWSVQKPELLQQLQDRDYPENTDEEKKGAQRRKPCLRPEINSKGRPEAPRSL